MAFGDFPATVDPGDYGLLKCKCGGTNLHQENQTSSFPSQDTCNPSPRRQGMLIEFYCEGCEGALRLAVFQHKGSTYMEWV